LDKLEEGRGGSLFLIAEAGLGKTSLLRRTESEARSGTRAALRRCAVAKAEGLLFGSGGAFRFADQMFASLGVDLQPATVDPHGEAHRSNRFLAALHTLEQSSRRQHVALLLDDLHWSDLDSLALVEFLCGQVASMPVVVVATLRPWPPDATEVARRLERNGSAHIRELSPLSRDAARALMESRVWGEIAPSVIEQASSLCGGNPLLIEEVARSLVGGSEVPAVEPFSTGRRAILLRRFAGVSDDTYRFLRAASVLGSAFRSSVVARMVDFDARATDRALEEASAAGLIGPGLVSEQFAHPMFSGALYEGLQGPLRSELHEAAFRAIRFVGGSPGEAAEQAMMADLTDEVAVSSVRAAGVEALRSGAWSTAVRFLRHAVQVTGAESSPAMVRELAEALASSGRPEEATEMIEQMLARPGLSPLERGRALVVLGEARLACGRLEAPLDCFNEAATLLEPLDPSLAVDALLRGAFIARTTRGPRKTMDMAERARALSPDLSRATRLQIDAAWGAGAVMLGDPDGFDVLSRTVETIEADPELLDEFSDSGWWPILWFMMAATFTERFDEAQHAYDLGFSAAERMGWPAAMGGYLISEVLLMQRLGHLDRAESDLQKLESIAPLIPFIGMIANVVRTGLDLEHGSLVEAEKGCQQMESILELYEIPGLVLWILSFRAKLEMSSGRLDQACAIFARAEQIATELEINEPCVTPWWLPAIDGYRAAGRFADLERIVGWLDRGTVGLPCLWPRACALAGRALIDEAGGEIDSATARFAEALDLIEGLEVPLDRAELLTWQGRFFYRQEDLGSARRSFSSAYQLADSRGAGLIAATARSELRRAGGRVRRDKREAHELTARQAQVAYLASTGQTSVEIADQLHIKRRTVEHHLEAVYRQWGIGSRRDLMRMRFSGELPIDDGDPDQRS
jgi:DNA-binding CsgD family transcriptional regulator